MSDPSPADLLTAALEISEAAAAIPMRYFRSGVAVEDKADESPVTIADRETEKHIRDAILKRFPAHGILGEEFGRSDTASDYTWIVDPIDGTRSFISGVPLFGMLLGVHARRRDAGRRHPHAGARRGVRRLPRRRRDDERQADPLPPLAAARARQHLHQRGEPPARAAIRQRLTRLMGVGHLRRFFNDCYPFGLLAMGQIDVVVDCDLQPYDYLPVVPVVEAAGGVITDWQGQPLGLQFRRERARGGERRSCTAR